MGRPHKHESWHDRAIELRSKGLSLRDISADVEQDYYTVRYFLRTNFPGSTTNQPVISLPELNEDSLLTELKTKRSLFELSTKYKVHAASFGQMVESLRARGFKVNTDDPGYVSLERTVRPERNEFIHDWDGAKELRFGVVSDTHIGSTHQQITFLHNAYRHFKELGITKVYHAGDISEGSGMRRGHEYEIFVHGADAQVKYIGDNYPYESGITTYFITGNHDLSHYKNAGHDIGISLKHLREDFIYLGPEHARIRLTPQCRMDLWHGRDGSAYAHSYAIQKYIESIPGGDKPKLLFAGHRHKALWTFDRNVHAWEAGCFQSQTPFMRGKKLAAHLGYYVITLTIGMDGTPLSVGSQFHPLYTPKERDF